MGIAILRLKPLYKTHKVSGYSGILICLKFIEFVQHPKNSLTMCAYVYITHAY